MTRFIRPQFTGIFRRQLLNTTRTRIPTTELIEIKASPRRTIITIISFVFRQSVRADDKRRTGVVYIPPVF